MRTERTTVDEKVSVCQSIISASVLSMVKNEIGIGKVFEKKGENWSCPRVELGEIRAIFCGVTNCEFGKALPSLKVGAK